MKFVDTLGSRLTTMQKCKSNLSVKSQKSESQNGGNKGTKHINFFEKRTFLTP